MQPGEYLDDFWEASSLNHLTIDDFARRSLAFDGAHDPVDRLARNESPYPLPLKVDRLQKVFLRRRSRRGFAPTAISENSLGQIVGALASDEATRRLYPSAGGLTAVEVFALMNRVDTPLGRVAARYLPASHALAPLERPLPAVDELDRLCSLEGSDPALILVFAVRLAEMVAKYGERGGRFALIEVGHACQNVALRLADLGLIGYQLGGVLDTDLEQLFELRRAQVRVTLGFAIGATATRQR